MSTLAAERLTVANRLDEVSLELRRGEITSLCGPNGAGKSTLLETLAGLITPDAGRVLLGTDDLAQFHSIERAKRLGYLPQSPEIAWDVPVRSLIELGRMPHGDKLAGPVDAAIAALDLGALAERRALSLSGGETARVLLARVLAGTPEWILADEPLAALDLAHQFALLRHLRRAADAGTGAGTGVVLVLHDLALAMNHADRVVVLDGGSVVADGPPHSALAADVIARVWKVATRWIGEPGRRALVTAD
ncbi:ferrichrome ABC transporter ATP-binding protein [Erythrobacter sp. QSSC1-22B]|uniref:ABC transporter ATP-binding protein n=1 Tax=Erythrobacter sp. QSSC1-22B TaxID=1860125 RepID=UPI0008052ECA|nr:ABC transporter ATP-binding protein [Erythrobacter sp. QSSC1-22B]OBX20512.1 ferrichrome ABC transporter ATP-binding protein [Erythrobacter sp. QSSC1-22B]